MLRKAVITLLAVASVGLAAPTMALARAGGGGGGGGGGHGGGGSFGGGHGGLGGGGFHGGGFAGSFQVAASKAAASVLGWPTVSEMEDSTIVTVAVSTIATLDAVLETDFPYDYYDGHAYDYPYGYGYDNSGSCYVVRRRVHTSNGWRQQPVQVCG